MNIEYQYYICHEGQRWLVWGLVEALVSIHWIRIAQIDTKTHLPTELILHSLPFGCFFVFFISSIHFFIHSVDFWKGRGDMSWGICVCFGKKKKNPAISSATFSDCRVTGSYIFPLPLPALSQWNRSSVFKELKRSGRKIQGSAGNVSRAEMLLGKGKQKGRKPPCSHRHCSWPWGQSESEVASG